MQEKLRLREFLERPRDALRGGETVADNEPKS